MGFASIYPIVYRVLKPVFPRCLWSGDQRSPAIALTFDDGPHPQYTPQLLDVLERYAVPASFFWLGICVERSPQVAKAVYDRGHWVGIHGYKHRSFPLMRAKELKQSLEQTQRAIAQACQIDPHKIQDVRPPNGLFTPQTLNLLRQWHYRPVMWSIVPEDWMRPGIAIVMQRVIRQVENGSLIVLHDGDYGGQDVAQITAQLIPLLAQSYKFVTIPQLSHCLK